MHEFPLHSGSGDLESSDPGMLALSAASQKRTESSLVLLQRKQVPPMYKKPIQVWSLKVSGRTNILLLTQSEGDSAF